MEACLPAGQGGLNWVQTGLTLGSILSPASENTHNFHFECFYWLIWASKLKFQLHHYKESMLFGLVMAGSCRKLKVTPMHMCSTHNSICL